MSKENISVFIKEFLRLLVLALPSFLVGLVIEAATSNPGFSTGVGAIVLALLKSYDRKVYSDKSDSRTGLLPF